MVGNKPKHQILLTLNRFYRDCRTKNKIIDEQLVQLLRQEQGRKSEFFKIGFFLEIFKKSRSFQENLDF